MEEAERFLKLVEYKPGIYRPDEGLQINVTHTSNTICATFIKDGKTESFAFKR